MTSDQHRLSPTRIADGPSPTPAVVTGHGVDEYRLSGVSLRPGHHRGEPVLEMRMPAAAVQDPSREQLSDRDFMAWLPIDFHDGAIEVDLLSELETDAPGYARGFIGLAFRIDAAGRFESVYLRPTNSVADDQVRRNHTVQYVSYPDYRFDHLRREAPERYETYADIGTGRWVHMRLVVEGERVRLHLDGKAEPAFLVNDMKLGAQQRGGVGIWLESGTFARFRNLRVTLAD